MIKGISKRDVVTLSGYSALEVLVQIFGFLIFSIALCLKIEEVIDISWWYVFTPLLVADACTLYFSVIVYIRLTIDDRRKEANKRELWIFVTLSLAFAFKILLVYKLEGRLAIPNANILAPLFVLWIIIFLKSCKVK